MNYEEQLKQHRLDALLRKMIKLIMEAEDAEQIDEFLTFAIAPDGCKVTRSFRVDEQSGVVNPCPTEVVFDNTVYGLEAGCSEQA